VASVAGSSGTFNQTGGTNSAVYLELASSAGSSGTYNLSNSASLTVADEYIGFQSVFNQTGGANSVHGFFELGNSAGSSGTYNLSGSGSLTVVGAESIGYHGNGVFNQTGGTNSALSLSLGSFAGSSGTYNLSNSASLTVTNGGFAGDERIGDQGNGTFNQTGGTHSADSLELAYSAGSSGTFNLSGSGSLTVTGNEFIGEKGNGVFNQTGGSNSVGLYSGLYLGYFAGSSGTYNLSNSASLTVDVSEYVGISGTGTLSQSGGSHSIGFNNGSIGGSLYLGGDDAPTHLGSGSYLLSGGSLSIHDNEYVGYAGTGQFTQSGGTQVIGALLSIGTLAGASGTVNLRRLAHRPQRRDRRQRHGHWRHRTAQRHRRHAFGHQHFDPQQPQLLLAQRRRRLRRRRHAR
jgi:hypothetical protein